MSITIIAVLSLLACGDKDDDTGSGGTGDGGTGDGGSSAEVAWTIAHHLTVCSAEGQWLCPLGTREGSGSSISIPCGIDGLSFQWGTTYQIMAEITGFSDPALDGCGDVWTLRSVESETFDGAGVSFALDGLYDVMITPAKGGGTLQGGHPFVCASTEVCDIVATITPDWAKAYDLDLEIGAAVGDPLILTAITER